MDMDVYYVGVSVDILYMTTRVTIIILLQYNITPLFRYCYRGVTHKPDTWKYTVASLSETPITTIVYNLLTLTVPTSYNTVKQITTLCNNSKCKIFYVDIAHIVIFILVFSTKYSAFGTYSEPLIFSTFCYLTASF